MKSTVEKLEKTRKSLSNHVARGNTMSEKNMRSFDLVDRYNDLKEVAKAEGVWEKFCAAHLYDPTHDAYDYFA